MANRQSSRTNSASAAAKFVFAALFALSFLFAQSLVTSAYADKKAEFGRIKISTPSGSYPLILDGDPIGNTTPSARLLDVAGGRTHKIEILFPNGERWVREFAVSAGRIYCIGLNYEPKTITVKNPLPCPYPVNVTSSSVADDGEVITFSANVAYAGSSALNYTWAVSPASAVIVDGAGSPTIMVDTKGLGGQTVTAILVVDDGSGESLCRQTSQASTPIRPKIIIHPKCYDCFDFVAFDDTKARLDNFAIELQNSPSSQGYIIAYAGAGSRAGQADKLIKRAQDYMIKDRGIDASRLTVINGGYRDTDYFELWVVPLGAAPPQATPTVPASDVRPAPDNVRPRRSRRG